MQSDTSFDRGALHSLANLKDDAIAIGNMALPGFRAPVL